MPNEQIKYAKIIVPVPIEGLFTYSVPLHLQKQTDVGSVVKCSFGQQQYVGIVSALTDKNDTTLEIKNISDVIYPGKCIPSSILSFWHWMAEYYMCAIGDVLKAAIPSSVIPTNKPTYTLIKHDEHGELKRNEKLVHDLLLSKAMSETALKRNIPLKQVKPLLNRMLAKGYVAKNYNKVHTEKARTEIFLHLAKKYQNEKAFRILMESLKGAKAKRRALLAVFENQGEGGITKKQLRDLFNISSGTYKHLLESGALHEEEKAVVDQLELNGGNLALLSIEQERAYNAIARLFKQKSTILLHGVTSSGKTEVYFHLISDFVKKGKQVLVLLPEITLTNNIVARFYKVFGVAVKVYHSKVAEKERAKIWHGVRENHIKLIVGVRSAVFLPFANLGLTIVDEEHENTYKQDDPAPRYHARDALAMLTYYQKAKILLGSATPSIQSYYNATEGKYGLVTLNQRHRKVALPKIIVEDLIDCYNKRKIKKHFSFTLIKTIDEALKNEQQIILFQNRRGYAPSVSCKACGYVHLCPTCNVSLTVHKTGRKLECHYCGHTEAILDYCPECNSAKLRDQGMGTEKIEDEINALFPAAKAARIDTDTAGKTLNVQHIFREFGAGNVDILVGTQMISKGLDFDNVGVVGILNADNLINFPNYHASERSFQLLTQVAGRAGRKHGNGVVVVQTHQPNHNVLDSVKEHDFVKFYEQEIEEREVFRYPPFVRLVHINMRHISEQTVEQYAQQLTLKIYSRDSFTILGPEKPGIDKIKNYYYRRIILKMGKGMSRKNLKNWLQYHAQTLRSQEPFRTVIVNFDADPLG